MYHLKRRHTGSILTVMFLFFLIQGFTETAQAQNTREKISHITLELSSHAIKPYVPVSITGKFSLRPDCGNRELGNIPIVLTFSNPRGETIQRDIHTSDSEGTFSTDYSGFDITGKWMIQAEFKGDSHYSACESASVLLHVKETAGHAILVQGKDFDGEGLESHAKTTQFVYKQLKKRGYTDENIQYLAYSDPAAPEVIKDGVPSRQTIRNAVI